MLSLTELSGQTFKLQSELILHSYSRFLSFVQSSSFIVFQPIELLLHEFTSYSDSNLYSCYFSFFFCSVFRYHFSLLPLLYVTFALIEFFKGNHMSLAEWSETYAIHDWMIIRKSSRNSAWVKFELTITEFCS